MTPDPDVVFVRDRLVVPHNEMVGKGIRFLPDRDVIFFRWSDNGVCPVLNAAVLSELKMDNICFVAMDGIHNFLRTTKLLEHLKEIIFVIDPDVEVEAAEGVEQGWRERMVKRFQKERVIRQMTLEDLGVLIISIPNPTFCKEPRA